MISNPMNAGQSVDGVVVERGKTYDGKYVRGAIGALSVTYSGPVKMTCQSGALEVTLNGTFTKAVSHEAFTGSCSLRFEIGK